MNGWSWDLEELLKVAKNEQFQEFLANPKVRALMLDAEFREAVKERNMFKLMSNREFTKLLEDPKIRSALAGMKEKFAKE